MRSLTSPRGALNRADPMAADRVFPIRWVVKKNRFGEDPFAVGETEAVQMVADLG